MKLLVGIIVDEEQNTKIKEYNTKNFLIFLYTRSLAQEDEEKNFIIYTLLVLCLNFIIYFIYICINLYLMCGAHGGGDI